MSSVGSFYITLLFKFTNVTLTFFLFSWCYLNNVCNRCFEKIGSLYILMVSLFNIRLFIYDLLFKKFVFEFFRKRFGFC